MISSVVRSALHSPPDTPNGDLRAHILKGQIKVTYPFALKETIKTRRKHFLKKY